MRGFQAMAKFTQRFANMEIKQIHTSKIDGWRGCQTTKQGDFADWESHPNVQTAFDSLFTLPSLLIHRMQIVSLPQARAICCDEVGSSDFNISWYIQNKN
jgi:hypothetical protein